MARRFARNRKSVAAPGCSTAACSRKHVHLDTRLKCIDGPGSRYRCSAAAASGLGHSHNHHRHDHDHPHDHRHDHGHHHHHHHSDHHDHDHYPDNWATRAMRCVGLVQLASRIEHSGPLAVASILCFVVSLLAAVPPLVGTLLSERTAAALQTAALCGTYLLSGLPQAVSSVALAAGGHLDTHVLMSLAVAATLYLGLAQEGALLLLLFQVSHFLEAKFTSRAQGSLERLLAAIPERATLVAMTQPPPHVRQPSQPPQPPPSHGTEEEVDGAKDMNNGAEAVSMASSSRHGRSSSSGSGSSSSSSSGIGPDLSSCREVLVESVAVGELVLVRPGEQVPLDGEVVWGAASVSAAHISGESAPSRVAAGGWVPAGALSTDGALVVRVTAAAADSTPARIARMASEAQASKPQLQRLLDRVGAVWSRGVVAATLLAAAVLLAAGVPLMAAPGGAVYRALGVLVAGSPCAVVLVPLAYVCAMAAVTRKGVLLKGASALDALAACTTVALDKTGTLTTGELRLTEATLLDYSWMAEPLRPLSSPPPSPPPPQQPSPQPAALSAPASAALMRSVEEEVEPGRGRDLLPLLQRAAAATAASAAAAGYNRSSGGESGNGSSSDGEGWDWWPQAGPTGGDAPYADGGEQEKRWWGEVAARCAVALSRASTHPVSRAVVQAGPGLERGLSVSDLEQVPGSGVRAVCRLRGRAFHVAFGSRDFAEQALADAVRAAAATEAEAAAQTAVSRLRAVLARSDVGGDRVGGAAGEAAAAAAVKAISLLVVTPLAAPTSMADGSVAAGVGLTPGGGGGGGGGTAVGDPRVALFCFEDVVRPGVREAVAALQNGSWRRRRGERVGADEAAPPPPSGATAALRVVMLTGDNPAVAASVAGGLAISEYRAAMLPQDKLQFVQQEQRHLRELQQRREEAEAEKGRSPLTALLFGRAEGPGSISSSSSPAGAGAGGGAVLMMGDGINDAPALAAAHVGVAVASSPRDLVAAASDVVVLNGQGAAALPWLLRLAHRTRAVVHQNLTLALASMVFATLPTVAGFFPLWLAVLLHEGSTLAVALNSLRLLLPEGAEGPGTGPEVGAAAVAAAAAGTGAVVGGVKFGPRAALAEVWRGLCDLAAPEPHNHNHHHHHGHHHHDHHHHDHHHDHDHDHGPSYSSNGGKAQVRACCGGAHQGQAQHRGQDRGHGHHNNHHSDCHHNHDHHHDHHHGHHHEHHHEHEGGGDHDHEHGSGNDRKRSEVVAMEAPPGGPQGHQAKPHQAQQRSSDQVEEEEGEEAGKAADGNGGAARGPVHVRGPVGRDVSTAASAAAAAEPAPAIQAPHARGHARHCGGGGGGGNTRSCCTVWGCISGPGAAANAVNRRRYGVSSRLGPLLALGDGVGVGFLPSGGCAAAVGSLDAGGALRRRRRVSGLVGPGVRVGVGVVAAAAPTAAAATAAAAAALRSDTGDRVAL